MKKDTEAFIEKLNRALGKMDCLESVQKENIPNALLRLSFTCPDGGLYEDVTLEVDFLDPIIFHLPSWSQATFQIVLCPTEQFKEIIPNDSIDQYGECVQFVLNDKVSPFYIHFDSINWRVKGESAYIKNGQELLDEDHFPAPELPEGFEEQMAKTGELIEKVFEGVIKTLSEGMDSDEKDKN
jgi:hypothetical protein